MVGSLSESSLPDRDENGLTANPKKSMDAWLDSSFLSAEDASASTALSIRDFINYARYETQDTAWFTNEMVDWALETVRIECNIEHLPDTVIANTYISSTLHDIGAGIINPNQDPQAVAPYDRLPLQERYAAVYEALKGKQYIFLPVNNGMAQGVNAGHRYRQEQEKKQQENGVEQRQRTEPNDGRDVTMNDRDDMDLSATGNEPTRQVSGGAESGRELARGSHWSFILVDTRKNTARYIDSVVQIVQSRTRKHKISNIEWNGPVAGTILCGFDTFMGRNEGGFTTSTLKWTPHQYDDNNSDAPDAGACGPYVYALMKHILGKREDTLKPGVKHYFTEARKADRVREVRFDSVEDRKSLQDQLWEKRRKKETSSAGSEAVVHPVNLSPDNLAKVLTPEVLREFLTTDILRRLLEIHDPPKMNTADSATNSKDQIRRLNFYSNLRFKYNSSTKWENFDHEILKEAMYIYNLSGDLDEVKDVLYNYLSNILRSGSSNKDVEWEKRRKFAMNHNYGVPSDLSLNEWRILVWDEMVPLREQYNRENNLPLDDMGPRDGLDDTQTQSYDTTKSGNLVVPEGMSLPKDFADSKEVDKDALERWKETNRGLIEQVIPLEGKERAIDLSYRAALHAWCGRRFAKENNQRALNIWASDSYAVPHTDSTRTASEIRELMHETYEVVDGLELPDDASLPPPPPPGGGNGPLGKPAKPGNGKGPVKGKKSNNAKRTGTAAEKQPLAYPKGKSENNIPQFAVNDKVGPWLDLNSDLFTDWGRNHVDVQTQRALLHQRYKGNFEDGQQRYLRRNWLTDLYAFSPEEQQLKWTDEDVAARMDDVYYNLDPPLFAASPEEEIIAWIQSLPEHVKGLVTDKDGNYLIPKARGFLRRLFVGDFEKLREPGEGNIERLREWCANDPMILAARRKGRLQDDSDALNQLNAYYNANENLPFLGRSPLHWPPQEYLASRGQKRKRGDEASVKDASRPAKKVKKQQSGNFPRGIKALPFFPYLSEAELAPWKSANASTIHPRPADDDNDWIWKARLWLLWNDSFNNEIPENLKKGWLQDENVFTDAQRRREELLSAKQIARMMVRFYEEGDEEEDGNEEDGDEEDGDEEDGSATPPPPRWSPRRSKGGNPQLILKLKLPPSKLKSGKWA